MNEFADVRQAIAEDNLEQARDLLRNYIKQQPDSAEVWYLAAKAAINATQHQAFLEKAVEIDPLHAHAANELYDLHQPREKETLLDSMPVIAENYDFGSTLSETSIAIDNDSVSAPPYADIGQRFGAFMLDQILLMIAILPIIYLALILLPADEGNISQADGVRAWSIVFTASTLLQALYFGHFLTHHEGQTIGKRMMKVRVVKRDGSPLTLWDAILRSTIGYTLAIIPFGIGFGWAAFDKQAQAWHDMIADTIVIEA